MSPCRIEGSRAPIQDVVGSWRREGVGVTSREPAQCIVVINRPMGQYLLNHNNVENVFLWSN